VQASASIAALALHSPRSGAVVAISKNNRAFLMAEERWSVAVAKIYSTPFEKTCKPEN
jgi:hypothetical protein